jgi:hypothetical protein
LGSVRLSIHAGIGFVMTVIAHIVLLVMPIADKLNGARHHFGK